jgi:RNA ligase
MFPKIKHINDVLPYIQGKTEFIVAEREDYTVIDYVVQKGDTFVAEDAYAESILRECRGIVFDKSGNLIRRPLHKFDNLNQNEAAHYSNVDWDSEHVLWEKMDGSMIAPIPIDGDFRLGTRMGVTDVAIQAEKWLSADHTSFINTSIKIGMTPIFEYIGPDNRIVIRYDEPQLVLLALRYNETGEYYSPDYLKNVADCYKIPVARSYGSVKEIKSFLEIAQKEEDKEGYVVAFATGERYKIKNELYLNLHKSKDLMQSKRNIVLRVLDNTIDDLKGLLFDSNDLAEAIRVEKRTWELVDSHTDFIQFAYNSAREKYVDKKDVALNGDQTRETKSYIFAMWDGKKTARDLAIEDIRSNCSQDKVYNEKLSSMIG